MSEWCLQGLCSSVCLVFGRLSRVRWGKTESPTTHRYVERRWLWVVTVSGFQVYTDLKKKHRVFISTFLPLKGVCPFLKLEKYRDREFDLRASQQFVLGVCDTGEAIPTAMWSRFLGEPFTSHLSPLFL